MKKDNYVIFIINEIITIIIQYFLIWFFFYFIFKTSLLVSIIVPTVIFLFCLLITISTYSKLHNFASSDADEAKIQEVLTKNPEPKTIIEEIVDKVNNQYHTNLIIKYVDIDGFGPAWITKNIVFINIKYLFLNKLLKGVIGHEIGHYFTKVCTVTFFDSLKIGSMFSRVFRYLYLIIYNKNPKKTFGFKLVYALYLLFSLFDIIFIYNIMKKDELSANAFAVELGYGNELRCYYGAYCLKYNTKDYQLLDLMHPSVQLMIDKIDNKIYTKKIYNKNIYLNDTDLYYAVIETKTYVIPDAVTRLNNGVLYSDTLIKLNLNDVTSIEYNALNNLPNLEFLIIPSKDITNYNLVINILKRVKNLKEVTITNQELYELLVQDNYFEKIKINLK